MKYYSQIMPPFWETLKQENPGYAQSLLDQYRASRKLPPLDLQSLRGRKQRPRGRHVPRAVA